MFRDQCDADPTKHRMALLLLLLLVPLPLSKPQVLLHPPPLLHGDHHGHLAPLPHIHLLQSPNPKNGPFCEQFVEECLDGSSFPNIGQAFRGYNLILGDPLNYGGDPGFKGHIFDEAGERHGKVRFGNTAGNDLNRCDGSVRADFIETSEEFRESIMRSKSTGKSFKVGPELEVSATAEVPGTGVGVGVSRTIPPYAQSGSSNSQVTKELLEGFESNSKSITRAGFSCYEYEFEITEYQHPGFAGQFLSAVDSLESCLLDDSLGELQPNKSSIIEGKTAGQDECAIKFLENYGSHYIKAARFGSKMSILTVINSTASRRASKNEMEKCATENIKFSFLGLAGGGSDSSGCMEELFESSSSSARVVEEEIVVTVGSRPKADYSDWAEQMGKPEIVHKTIAPISDLFTNDFMKEISFKENGDATIKEILETYIVHYCGLFKSECNYVVNWLYCQKKCTGSIIGNIAKLHFFTVRQD